MLNQIFGKGKKEEQRASPEDGHQDADRGELPSEVDDIITTFDNVLGTNCQEQPGDQGPMVGFKKRTPEDSKYLWPEKRPLARQGLPPIRTQSLPPITAGNSFPTACPGAPSHTSLGPGPGPQHAGPPSQKSWSEQDLLHSRPGGQALRSDLWHGDAHQGLCQAWPASTANRLLDRLLCGRPKQQDVPGPPHLPHLHSPSAGKVRASSILTPVSLSSNRGPLWGGAGVTGAGRAGPGKMVMGLFLCFFVSHPPLRTHSRT